MAVRCAAAATQKFASSIAPHITTLLVHGKQVNAAGVSLLLHASLYISVQTVSETSPGFSLTGEHASLMMRMMMMMTMVVVVHVKVICV